MSITAEQLSRAGSQGKDLDAIVRNQLQIIDDRLQRADRVWGRNIVSHELPTVFSLPGLEKKDAQRIVYTAIVRSLQDRGFGIRLLLNANRTILFLEWVTSLNSEEVNAMNHLIRSVRIAPEDLEGFLYQDNTNPSEKTLCPASPGRTQKPPREAAALDNPSHKK
ncbi:hypothetical protein ElyMa_002514200 [Elysia marginata]|uniref:Uncharacterized protein n=1 Tax=Elysia marginata TaxID=1093978 RepID=A0AAV4GRB5_9GAST|nr:hypothetical protein ElyMa_002514200 [Elysia marginata]